MSAYDDVVLLLARETLLSTLELRLRVNMLQALGWTPHQIRRGIGITQRTGLPFRAFCSPACIDVPIDELLDALMEREVVRTGGDL